MLSLLKEVALEDFSGFLTHTQHHLNQEYFISDILLPYFSGFCPSISIFLSSCLDVHDNSISYLNLVSLKPEKKNTVTKEWSGISS